MTRKTKKIINIGAIIVGGLMLFISSEFIFMYKNRPEIIGAYYLWQAKIKSSSDTLKSVNLLRKSAYWYSKFDAILYRDKLPEPVAAKTDNTHPSELFRIQYTDFLNREVENPFSISPVIMAKNFYKIGLIAFENNMSELAIDLLRPGIYLNPASSYHFIELANIYLEEEQIEESRLILSNCQKFEVPKQHCEEYQKNNLETRLPLEVGHFKDFIDFD